MSSHYQKKSLAALKFSLLSSLLLLAGCEINVTMNNGDKTDDFNLEHPVEIGDVNQPVTTNQPVDIQEIVE